MSRLLRITLIALAGLLIAAWAGWSYLTAREAVPETSTYALDLAEVRRLAAAPTASLPVRVNAEQVAVTHLPRAGVFAGEPFDPHAMTHQVFQLVYSDRFVLIDAGMGPEMFAEMDSGGGSFDEAGFANVQQALGSAAQILITHEHVDHIGGLVEHDAPERLVGRLRLTREQLDNVENVGQLELPPELGSGVEPLDYERLLAVAPGIVLIKAAGHTPGTQMIYVRLADARELLFLGEDRRAVLAQFRTLHDLMQAEPDLELIVSHDREQRRRLIESRIMGAQLEL